MEIVVYDGKYIDNLFQFTLIGYINKVFTDSLDNYAQLLMDTSANLTHFYRLELESFKSSNNVTANLKWDLRTSETTFEIQIRDYQTTLKGKLSPFIIVHFLYHLIDPLLGHKILRRNPLHPCIYMFLLPYT